MMNNESKLIELAVRNHPGVMSHITGLFSRRGYNLEGILCGPVGDGSSSRMYLLVNNESRMEQVISQLEKLYDVLELKVKPEFDRTVFSRLDELV